VNKKITFRINLIFLFEECRQLCKQSHLNEAKNLFQSIENLINDEYLFPNNNDKFYQQHYPLYESFQRSVRQLRSDISQTHIILWNDGIDRQNKNEFKINTFYLDQLFQCVFSEEKGEKVLMEKNIQTFALYCLQGYVHMLIEKRMKLIIDIETNMILIRIENDDEIDRNDNEQFHEIFNYLKRFFETLNTYLLSRIMKVQTSNDR
jgi:hypothetical protein